MPSLHPAATRLRSATLAVALFALCAPRPGLARSGPRTYWLRAYSSARLADSQRVRALLGAPGPEGGRVRQVFLRRGTGPQGTTLYEVLTGPWETVIDGVLEGLRLRADPRFARAGVRLTDLAVLLPSSFVPVPLLPDDRVLERLNPGGKRPYPALADLLTARGLAFSHPQPQLPALQHATAQLTPFAPLLVLGERDACAGKGTRCLRWFEVLHPQLVQTAWVPAYLLVRHRDLRAMELADGAGRTRARGALWRIGRTPAGTQYALMFRRGSLPPQRFTLTLTERQGPPFRLLADKHGPGIYNAEGKVVHRPTVGPWIYQRPPLWQIPEHLKAQLRRAPRPAPRRRPRPRARPSARPGAPRPRR